MLSLSEGAGLTTGVEQATAKIVIMDAKINFFMVSFFIHLLGDIFLFNL